MMARQLLPVTILGLIPFLSLSILLVLSTKYKMSGQEAAALESLKRAQEGIGSRFETQTSIDEAKARKEEEWKNAYARCVVFRHHRGLDVL